MKKVILLLAALALMCLCVCAAEEQPVYTIIEAGNYMSSDFDYDGIPETMMLRSNLNSYGDGSFVLSVNGQSFTMDNCISLDPTVYAMRYGYYATLFMINEYGPSDDPITYCFYYDAGKLSYVGNIYSMVQNFTVSNDGVITAPVRNNMIGTWSRPADFVLAWGYSYDYYGDFITYAQICEVPRDVYPMGMIVTLNYDLPLYASRWDNSASTLLTGNRKVILAASDDVSWLYVTDFEGVTRGWVRMMKYDYADYLVLDTGYVAIDDIFADILYAD